MYNQNNNYYNNNNYNPSHQMYKNHNNNFINQNDIDPIEMEARVSKYTYILPYYRKTLFFVPGTRIIKTCL